MTFQGSWSLAALLHLIWLSFGQPVGLVQSRGSVSSMTIHTGCTGGQQQTSSPAAWLPAMKTAVRSTERDPGSICRRQQPAGGTTAVQQRRTQFYSSEETFLLSPRNGSQWTALLPTKIRSQFDMDRTTAQSRSVPMPLW